MKWLWLTSLAWADLVLEKLTVPTARCLDGTPGGFYFRAAPDPSVSTNWMILLQGGGLCVTEPDCKARAKTTLGSSLNWTSTVSIYHDLLDQNATTNPHFYKWNQVFIPYCCGDVHSGQSTSTGPSQWGLYFAGQIIVDSVIDRLISEHGLQSGTTVVVTGESAGGIGAFYHAERIAAKLPKSKVFMAPIGGYFFGNDNPYHGPGAVPSPYKFGTTDFKGYAQLWNAMLHPACAKAKGPDAYQCLITELLYPYLTIPVFVNHALTDNVYLILGDNIPDQPISKFNSAQTAYVNEWGTNMTRSMQQIINNSKKGDGLYAPACYMHCGGQTAPLVPSLPPLPPSNFPDGLYGWLCNHDAVSCPAPFNPVIFIDSCTPIFPNCNPTCTSTPARRKTIF